MSRGGLEVRVTFMKLSPVQSRSEKTHCLTWINDHRSINVSIFTFIFTFLYLNLHEVS